jgi:hypothetical protein
VFRNFKDNNKFVGDLMDRVCELAWDENVNSYNIEKFDELNDSSTCLDGLDQHIDPYITPNGPALAVLWP